MKRAYPFRSQKQKTERCSKALTSQGYIRSKGFLEIWPIFYRKLSESAIIPPQKTLKDEVTFRGISKKQSPVFNDSDFMDLNIDQTQIGQKVLMHVLKDSPRFLVLSWTSNNSSSINIPMTAFSHCIPLVPLHLIHYHQWLNDFPVAITITCLIKFYRRWRHTLPFLLPRVDEKIGIICC